MDLLLSKCWILTSIQRKVVKLAMVFLKDILLNFLFLSILRNNILYVSKLPKTYLNQI